MSDPDLDIIHQPVLLKEVIDVFSEGNIAHLKDQKIIDATLGIGGHTLNLVRGGAKVLGVDIDSEMLELAGKRLIFSCPTSEDKLRGSYKLTLGSFRHIDEIALKEDFENVDGVLFDLGVSSPQLTSKTRGFSFREDSAELDMRLSGDLGLRARDLLNALRFDQLVDLFRVILNLHLSRRMSLEVVKTREMKPIRTVGDYKAIISKVIKAKKHTDESTLPFLALRIAVNSELESVKEALPKALGLLKIGGKIAVISFHSGEDRIVKKTFKDFERDGFGKVITPKPVVPALTEIKENPRSRSAKLRVFQKT